MEKELIRLNIVGISFTPIETGMYALVLEDEESERRLPIIIGYSEAQAIECLLQHIRTPRPLTHQLTSNILESFEIKIESVVIRYQENGVFTADITLKKGAETHVLDARSSDAIALAMRAGMPVFTTRDVLDKCGIDKESITPRNIVMAQRQSIPARQAIERMKNPTLAPFEKESDEDLVKLMDQAVEAEDYEKAGEIKLEIEKRRAAK